MIIVGLFSQWRKCHFEEIESPAFKQAEEVFWRMVGSGNVEFVQAVEKLPWADPDFGPRELVDHLEDLRRRM